MNSSKRQLLVCAAVMGLIIAMMGILGAQPIPPSVQSPKWQYATLLFEPLKTVQSNAILELPDRTVQDPTSPNQAQTSLVTNYRNLGGTKNAATVRVVDLLNLLGGQGWELVGIQPAGDRMQYVFKRSVAN